MQALLPGIEEATPPKQEEGNPLEPEDPLHGCTDSSSEEQAKPEQSELYQNPYLKPPKKAKLTLIK